jgi:hypothetical protein
MRYFKMKDIIYMVIVAVAFASLIYAIIDSVIDEILLSKNYRFTISAKISYDVGPRTGARNKYTFLINGKWYSGSTSLPLRRDGTKYFIKYYPLNPKRNEATNVIADSIDVKNLPVDGYKKLPEK